MVKRNIYLYGKAGSGKDEVAERIRSDYGYDAYALASPVRYEFYRFFDRSATRSDRAALIDIAETYKRLYGQNVWCRRTHIAILEDDQRFRRIEAPIIISDGRFLVEYDYFVTQRNYVPIRVHTPVEIRRQRLIERDGYDQIEIIGHHEDEVDVMKARYTIGNEGTLEALYAQVDDVMAKVMEGNE